MDAKQSNAQYGSIGDVEASKAPDSADGGTVNGTVRFSLAVSSAVASAVSSPARQMARRLTLRWSHRNADKGMFTRNDTVEELERSATDEEIETVIDLILPKCATGAGVIRQYRPQKWWLWRQWYGTVFHYGMWTAVRYMIFTLLVCLVFPNLSDPKNKDDLADRALTSFNQVWKYMLTFTTFIMTFFLNQAYNLWRQVYTLSRAVQGRTNDFGLLLATHAARDGDGKYTPEARKLLEDVAMNIRVLHAFAYATKTRGYRVLHTDRALERMVDRGFMTREMKDTIKRLNVAPPNRVYAMMEWIVARFRKGLKDGAIEGTAGFENMFLEKALLLRSQYGTFGDLLDARIPLAYVHFVQVMVDTMLLCAPFACYKDMGYFAIAAVGIITIFFVGLVDLSKVMLDPLDNEDYNDGVIDINVGVFIRESNNGSVRFLNGAEHLPPGWF